MQNWTEDSFPAQDMKLSSEQVFAKEMRR